MRNDEAALAGGPDDLQRSVAPAPALHIVLALEAEPRVLVASDSAETTARLREDLLARPDLRETVGAILDGIVDLRSRDALQ